ncbi:hypothetical protein ACSCB1_18315 [Streptomyces europaeiscabiei]|uniref:Uncharacterized protein n=1 Tax=Streptomyces europaeiscabiei TaxID=146819 RepID=A0ABU4NDK2_9ACTN|nr:hypothetical protein [Streptomyces europaeiscabiei]MDX2525543.1 hypothetical protein [Streptomyces europaeiscabiei]MDX2759298.1 hypothetical protein [Streptomyces europaeiscabiei]MDX3542902.1 hypothetical protein [Streptomyces europaeiscabiei]MDX3552718.1 hypothetical protein [Streptomyces europaeiscabiei]MDX3667441.1 hypothetical protein [Streptomyces europaeiscabiei]
MTTRTTKTFEDRLLDELQREIALRAEDAPEPVIRRTITTRRALVALAACVAAAGVVVALPSSTGGSQAYAVERHDDGTVTVTGEELATWEHRGELAEQLHDVGIRTSFDRPRSGYVCAKPRGETPGPEKVTDPNALWTYTLRPGDTMVFEDPEPIKDSVSPAGVMYVVKGKAKPCREVPWEGLAEFEASLK